MAGVRIEPFNVQLVGGDTLGAAFANGNACPQGQSFELYQDDFSYSLGVDVPNPPWTPFNQAPAGGVTVTTFVSALGLSCQAVAANVTYGTCRYRMWNQGYTNFNTTECGVYTEGVFSEELLSAGSGEQIGGLAIGVNDTATTTRLLWLWRPRTGQAGGTGTLFVTTDISGGGTVLVNNANLHPAVGDTCRLTLSRNNPFGWRLEAYINTVMVNSTTSASIQLTSASPKAIGVVFVGNGTAFLNGTSRISIANWRGGVT
jgi:hypothetical protein